MENELEFLFQLLPATELDRMRLYREQKERENANMDFVLSQTEHTELCDIIIKATPHRKRSEIVPNVIEWIYG